MPDTDTSLSSDLANLSAQEGAYRKEVMQAEDVRTAGAEALVGAATEAGDQGIARAKDFAASQQPFSEPPPKDQIGTVMSGAPWLFALASLGGKASKVNGLAMLKGLNGMSDGIIKGDEAALSQSWDSYKAHFDKWKANADQQFRIYQELEQAYGKAADGKLRALIAAQSIMNDNVSMQLQVDDPERMFTMRQKIIDNHLRLEEWKSTRELQALQKKNLQSEIDARDEKAKGQGSRSEQQFAAVGTSSDEAVQAIKNIMQLPGTASMGWLGRSEPVGILNQTKSGLANKVSAQEVQDYRVMATGIQRNLATIEAVGRATGLVGLSTKMEGVLLEPGDTQLTKLRKMAEARQIVEYGTKFFLDDPRVPEALKKHVRDNVEELKKAVPFTNADVTALEQAKNPKTSISDIMKSKGLLPAGIAEGKKIVSSGYSASTGKWYIRYSDGSTGESTAKPTSQ